MWRSRWFRAGMVANAAAIVLLAAAWYLDRPARTVAFWLMVIAFAVSFGLYVTAVLRDRRPPRAEGQNESMEQRLLAGALVIAGLAIAAFGHIVLGACLVAGAFLGYVRAARRQSKPSA